MNIETFLHSADDNLQKVVTSSEPSESTPNPLLGFDSRGEVFTSQGRVFRGVFTGHGQRVMELFTLCTDKKIFDLGIVNTSICQDKSINDMGYDLVLEHERVPFISYAHEWPADMLRDAALFQIDLSLELSRHDLWLMDCGVQSNVLFDSVRPVFIDFLSLCTSAELEDQEFLKPQAVRSAFSPLWSSRSACFNEIYERMFYPYLLYPLYMQHQGRHAETRRRLLATALNTCFEVITCQEALANADQSQILMQQQALAAREHSLVQDNWVRFLQILRTEITHLQPGTVNSNYTSYYDLKNENFDTLFSAEWGQKQRAVFYALQKFKPRTVLDVGANTGWFSILAAKLGCQVVSLDIDEASMNVLYRTAKSQGLSILPLVIDIATLPGDVAPFPGYEQNTHMIQSRLTTDAPLLLSAEKRIQCELVMALAIVHHLCLGLGLNLASLIDRLASFATKHLVLEFVAKEDSLIVAEPDFFPAYHKNPHLFDWYSQDNVTHELMKHFSRIETTESSAGRVLLICSR